MSLEIGLGCYYKKSCVYCSQLFTMTINKKLLPVKAHYFFGLAASAPVHAFIPLIIKEKGFSATATGTIAGIVPIFSMLTKPWVGAIVDKFQIHKAMLIFFILSNMSLTLLVRYIPSLPSNSQVTMICDGNTTQIVIATGKADDICFLNSLTASLNSSRTECEFLPNEWTGGFAQAVNRKDSMSGINSGLSSSKNHITLHSPFKKGPGTIAIHVKRPVNPLKTWKEPTCSNASIMTGELLCGHPLLHEVITKPMVQDSGVFNYSQYWIMLIVVLVFRIIGSCTGTLADSICFKILGKNHHDYGAQRMWGSAGWGLTSFLTGALVDKLSAGKATTDRSTAFYLGAILAMFDALVCLKFKVKEVHTKKNEHIFKNVTTLLGKNPKFIWFLVLVMACGVFSSFVWNFLMWLIVDIAQDDGCADKSKIQTLNGLISCVNCYLGEIPFFFLSGWFLRKIGYELCMALVLVAFGIRFISYYFLVNPWWILPIEMLNGISYGLFHATMATYANALTPPGLEGTMQGLVSAAFEGIGMSSGSLLGGFLFDRVGGRTLFLFGGAAALFLAASHCVLLLLWAEPSNQWRADVNSNNETSTNQALYTRTVEEVQVSSGQNHITAGRDEWD